METTANYRTQDFWNETTRNRISDSLIKISERVIPGLSRNLSLKIVASPASLYKLTNNYKGAICGWASTPKQFGNPDMSIKTKIENLYISGHWSNQSGGVAFVSKCGQDTANLVLRKERMILKAVKVQH